jgi:antitoxin component YwqK of YwqJK toxin-antitoxin module
VSGVVRILNKKNKDMLEGKFKKSHLQNVRNGKWKEFSRQAVLIAEGHYIQDLKQGLWKQYYETGELLIEEEYERGILHGRYAAYHLNGNVMSEGQYIHGKREGHFDIYDERGLRTRRLFFSNNLLIETIEREGQFTTTTH